MSSTVVFQTDFGSGGGAAMAGVVKCIDPEVPVYDFTHDIEPFNVREASYQLSSVVGYWPSGTVFVSVVDPGVGTDRRSCVALLSNGSYVVTPDNGTLTAVADQVTAVREIDETTNRLPGSEDVHIFNGRDVYAYTAGRLAAGVIGFEGVGPEYPCEQMVIVPLTNVLPKVGAGWAEGGIYDMDVAFGSLRVNVRNRIFQREAGFAYGDHIRVQVKDGSGSVVLDDVGLYERTFGFNDGSPVFVCGDIQPGEKQTLRLTVNGNFAKRYAPELLEDRSLAVDYVVRLEAV